MSGLADIVPFLKEVGIYEYYLPFVILFSLIFGLLNKSKIFGDDKKAKNLNIIISLAAAFYIMAYSPLGVTLTSFFANLFTELAVMLVTILAFMMIVALLIPITGKDKMEFPKAAKYIGIFGVLIAAGIYLSSGGLAIFPGLQEASLPGLGIDPQDLTIIVLIASIVFVAWWISRDEEGSGKSGVKWIPVKE